MKAILIAIATITLIGCGSDERQIYYQRQRNLIAQLPRQQQVPAPLQLNSQIETWRLQEDNDNRGRWGAVGQAIQNMNAPATYNNPIRVQVQNNNPNLVEPVIPGQ
jgi:hypothetical protein